MFIISPLLEAVAHDSPMLKDDHTTEHKNHESCGSPFFSRLSFSVSCAKHRQFEFFVECVSSVTGILEELPK